MNAPLVDVGWALAAVLWFRHRRQVRSDPAWQARPKRSRFSYVKRQAQIGEDLLAETREQNRLLRERRPA